MSERPNISAEEFATHIANRRVFEAALEVYTLEGVEIWMNGKNKAFGGRSPIELIRVGEVETVLLELRGLSDGVMG